MRLLVAAAVASATIVLSIPAVGAGAAFSWSSALTLTGPSVGPPIAVGGGTGATDVVYAAGVEDLSQGTGKIWRLVPGGAGRARWAATSTLDGGPMPLVDSIAAAGRGTSVAFASTSSGVIRTRDGGGTWSALSGSPPLTSHLAVSKSGRVVAGLTWDGEERTSRVSVSRDGGRTWRMGAPLRIKGRNVNDVGALALHPTHPRIVAAAVFAGGRAYTLGSTDSGRTWRAITRRGIRGTSPGSGPQKWSLAFAGGSPGRLVLAPGLDRATPSSGLQSRIWATASFGRKWRRSSGGVAVGSAVRTRTVDVVALGGVNGPVLLSRGRRTSWRTLAGNTRRIVLTQDIAVGPNGWVAVAGGYPPTLAGTPSRSGVIVGRLHD